MDEWKLEDGLLRDYIDGEVNRLLNVPDEDLRKCDALDLEYLEKLQEEELRSMLQRGYAEGAKTRAKARGISERAYEVARIIRTVHPWPRGRSKTCSRSPASCLRIAQEGSIEVPFGDEPLPPLYSCWSAVRKTACLLPISLSAWRRLPT